MGAALPLTDFAASTYYASPRGSSANTGLSTNSPWPLSYALVNAGAGNTVILMPGTYPGEVTIPKSYMTLKSQVKWGAHLVNSPAVGIATWPAGTVHDVTIDGIAVSYSRQGGVWLYGSNCIVRNCWVSHSGYGNAGAQDGSGIVSHAQPNTLIENNLLEYNGSTSGYDHGIYVGGTNVIVRGNVCRHNLAYGIQIYSSDDPMDQCQIYNNLIYDNNTGGGANGDGLIVYYSGSGVNSVFGNTIISSSSYCCQFHGGTVLLTNNILLSAGTGVYAYSPVTVLADYNLASSRLSVAGSHDVVTGTPGFVNTSKGLHWLGSNSPARGKALSTVFGAVDFFGHTQSSVTDIGALQYNSAYAADTRTLDPSTSAGADYWQLLGGGGSGSPTSPSTNGWSFAATAGVITAPFSTSNGYVSQAVDTENANGGTAVYTFTTSTAGVYVVTAILNAPNTSANSFYVKIDGAPADPYTIWDISVTSGFESRTVSWRGNGIEENDEFMPKAFALAPGTHSLTIMGREPNVQLQSIQIQPSNLSAPSAAPVLRLVTAP